MNIEERAGEMISRIKAIRIVKRHGISVSEFYAEMGEYDEYDTLAVMIWLGY